MDLLQQRFRRVVPTGVGGGTCTLRLYLGLAIRIVDMCRAMAEFPMEWARPSPEYIKISLLFRCKTVFFKNLIVEVLLQNTVTFLCKVTPSLLMIVPAKFLETHSIAAINSAFLNTKKLPHFPISTCTLKCFFYHPSSQHNHYESESAILPLGVSCIEVKYVYFFYS